MLKKLKFPLITYKMIYKIIYFSKREVSLLAIQNIHLRLNIQYGSKVLTFAVYRDAMRKIINLSLEISEILNQSQTAKLF